MIEINKNGYFVVKETGEYLHRIIMELMLGRKLEVGEEVNHINGDKVDNRPENLEVLSREEHQAKKPTQKKTVAEFFELLADKVKTLSNDDFEYAIEAFERIFKRMKFNERKFRRYCKR